MRATYRLHDRVLSNQVEPPPLRRLTARRSTTCSSASSPRLSTEGYCVVPFAELFLGAMASGARSRSRRRRFVADTGGRAGRRPRGAAGSSRQGVRRPPSELRRRARARRPLVRDLRLAPHARRRETLYLGLWSKLSTSTSGTRCPSRRTPTGSRLAHAGAATSTTSISLKAFPLHSSTSTPARDRSSTSRAARPAGAAADAWPWRPLGDNYPRRRRARASGSRGDGIGRSRPGKRTVARHGFHRGVRDEEPASARDGDVLVPASLASLTERSYRFRGIARRARRSGALPR